MRRNRHRPAPGQLPLPLGDPPPEGETDRPPAPRGWTPEGPVILDLEARRRERAAANESGPPAG
jgi:hypothetical protein